MPDCQRDGMPLRRSKVMSSKVCWPQSAWAGAERVVADIGNSGIFPRAGPGNAVDGGVEFLRDAPGVGFVADHLGGKQAQRLGKDDMRRAFGQVRREFRRSWRRQDFVRIDRVVLGIHGEVVADRELRRLAAPRALFQKYRTLQSGFRRDPVRGRFAVQEMQVFLLAGQGARVGQPGAHGFARRYGIGVYGQALRHAYMARRDAAAMAGQGRVTHFAMMGVGGFHRAVDQGLDGSATLQGLVAQAQQIRCGALEVQHAAVDELVFEQTRGIPARNVRVAGVGNLGAHARIEPVGRQGEIEQDAAHALALELQVGARGGGQIRGSQTFGDIRLGDLKLPRVDLRDDAAQIDRRDRLSGEHQRHRCGDEPARGRAGAGVSVPAGLHRAAPVR